MTDYRTNVFPFTAIVRQEEMKLALLLNALNPRIGGVLIRGHRGTAKSTAARALARVLPEIKVVDGCPFNCDPDDAGQLCPLCAERSASGGTLPAARRRTNVVTLPLGASEDRVLGTIDIEKAIKKGEKRFEPGVLAAAHRGILYVDEVNLLDDHIVDILLDAAAMGVNTVEREGISFRHPTRFSLIGTMNPEEGELRPQLLDRFGLCVNIEGEDDLEARTQIVRRRLEYELDPAGFVEKFARDEADLQRRVAEAQNLLSAVKCPAPCVDLAARVCLDMGADGHRADITVVKTAVTLAAFDGRSEATSEDIYRAAELALPHRMHKRQAEETRSKQEEFQQQLQQHRRQERPEPKESDEKKKTRVIPRSAPMPPRR
jgi:Mg-chelatase subunit ChlI